MIKQVSVAVALLTGLYGGVYGCSSSDDSEGSSKKRRDDDSTQTTQEVTTPSTPSTPTPGYDAGATVDPPRPDGGGRCAAGLKSCGGKCVSINDPAYGCGETTCFACPTTGGQVSCGGGKCAMVCQDGRADCDGNPANGCEADLTSAQNCGACGEKCLSNNREIATCQSALGSYKCFRVCQRGFNFRLQYDDCDGDNSNGCETNVQNDTDNCGGCGISCSFGQRCSNSECVD